MSKCSSTRIDYELVDLQSKLKDTSDEEGNLEGPIEATFGTIT